MQLRAQKSDESESELMRVGQLSAARHKPRPSLIMAAVFASKNGYSDPELGP